VNVGAAISSETNAKPPQQDYMALYQSGQYSS